MNPIDDLFRRLRAEKRKAFMPFVTAGDPDLAFTRELLPAVAEAGADLAEVGFPFSDPIADGPVIQASYTFACLSTVAFGPARRRCVASSFSATITQITR